MAWATVTTTPSGVDDDIEDSLNNVRGVTHLAMAAQNTNRSAAARDDT